jgi:hypothetical protein
MKYEIKRTKNYAMFSYLGGNRQVELKRTERKTLKKSLMKYGFISAFPIVCVRRDGKLRVKDGQGRLALAQELGLEVWYVVVDQDFDLAEINSAVAKWNWEDYATKFRADGNQNYQRVIDFAEQHGMKIATSAAVLAGTCSAGISNCGKKFKDGLYTVTTSEHADDIAHIYNALGKINPKIKNRKLISALHKLLFVPGFDIERLIAGAKGCPEKLINFGTTDGYLTMLEEVYNHRRRVKDAIKIASENAMKLRNPVNRGKPVEDKPPRTDQLPPGYMHA